MKEMGSKIWATEKHTLLIHNQQLITVNKSTM